MSEILQVIMQLSVLVFVIASMLSMGLSLTIKQIVAPLRNARLVILALVANFILVPLLAYLILLVIKLDEGLATGLILLGAAYAQGCIAGAGVQMVHETEGRARGQAYSLVFLVVGIGIVAIGILVALLP